MAKGRRSMKKNKYSGSSFDDFLKEEGIYEEVKTLAQKELASERYKRYPIVAVIIRDISNIQVAQPGPIRRFFQRFSQATQAIR